MYSTSHLVRTIYYQWTNTTITLFHIQPIPQPTNAHVPQCLLRRSLRVFFCRRGCRHTNTCSYTRRPILRLQNRSCLHTSEPERRRMFVAWRVREKRDLEEAHHQHDSYIVSRAFLVASTSKYAKVYYSRQYQMVSVWKEYKTNKSIENRNRLPVSSCIQRSMQCCRTIDGNQVAAFFRMCLKFSTTFDIARERHTCIPNQVVI